ncbi:hypothetical protein K488DRAFT_86656 [Vararia minispora EC-137]|uniref:Uncharacterized protein n=1 Tax=Vararia minispora EC-137 TaxID=1314806 RepID=A0ACB8QIQ5_9AGAM|nr:hypothetical protein K488DRAFT_86656 [Vararia minispora EC-137]
MPAHAYGAIVNADSQLRKRTCTHLRRARKWTRADVSLVEQIQTCRVPSEPIRARTVHGKSPSPHRTAALQHLLMPAHAYGTIVNVDSQLRKRTRTHLRRGAHVCTPPARGARASASGTHIRSMRRASTSGPRNPIAPIVPSFQPKPHHPHLLSPLQPLHRNPSSRSLPLRTLELSPRAELHPSPPAPGIRNNGKTDRPPDLPPPFPAPARRARQIWGPAWRGPRAPGEARRQARTARVPDAVLRDGGAVGRVRAPARAGGAEREARRETGGESATEACEGTDDEDGGIPCGVARLLCAA